MSRAKASELLARVKDAALDDLERATDDELLSEAAEDREDVESLATGLKTRVAEGMERARKQAAIVAEVRAKEMRVAEAPALHITSGADLWGRLHDSNLQDEGVNVSREQKRDLASSVLLKLHESCSARHCSHLSFDYDSSIAAFDHEMRLTLLESLLSMYIKESEELADLFPGSRVQMLRTLLRDAVRDPQIASFANISLGTLASTLCTLALGKASGFEFDPHQSAGERNRMLRQIRSRKEWRAFRNLIAHQPELVTDSLDASRAVSALATMQSAIAAYKPDAIVAVAGGGEIVASFLRSQIGLDARLYFIATRKNDEYVLDRDPFGGSSPKRVVIVDDISRTGKTLAKICNQTFGGISSAEFKTLALVSAAGATSPLRDRFLVLPVVAQSVNVSVPWDNKGSYKTTRADHVFGADRKSPALRVPKRFYERIYEDVTA